MKFNYNNLKKKFKSGINKYGNFSTSRKLFIYYFLITFSGTVLLLLPFARKDGHSLSVINALFTSASAFSDTGLTTVTTVSTFSFFGQFIIAALILVGGMGWFAIRVYFLYYVFGRRLPLRMRMVLQTERGESKIGQTKEVIAAGITAVLIAIIIATAVLTYHFYHVNNTMIIAANSPYHNLGKSVWSALFHSISAANNAGFDIVGSQSLMPYYHDYFVQFIFIVLLVFGGVGFPIFYDMKQKISHRIQGKMYTMSLLTKISLVTYFIVFVVGLIFAFIFETQAPSKDAFNVDSFWQSSTISINGGNYGYSLKDKIMAVVFSVFSTRSAGFSTCNMALFSDPTKFLFSILMFIGASPSSTGGGVRTTTFALTILGVTKMMSRNTQVQVFKRKIPRTTLINAYAVTIIALLLVISVSMVVMVDDLFLLNSNKVTDITKFNYHFTDSFYFLFWCFKN